MRKLYWVGLTLGLALPTGVLMAPRNDGGVQSEPKVTLTQSGRGEKAADIAVSLASSQAPTGYSCATTAGIKLFEEAFDASNERDNVVIAPGAILSALLRPAVAAGKGSDTEVAFQELSGCAVPLQEFAANFAADFVAAQSNGPAVLKQNAAMWLATGMTVNPDFTANYRKAFNGTPDTMDFAQSDATDNINNWVDAATHHIIDTIFDAPLPTDTGFVSVGTAYFKAAWETVFNPKDTAVGDFTTEGQTSQVRMMHGSHVRVKYLKTSDYQYVEIPFEGDGNSFVIIMPNDNRSLADVADHLGQILGNKQIAELKDRDMGIAMPALSLSNSRDLLTTYASGTLAPFFSGADLKDISPSIEGFGQAIQKTYLRIDENGGEGGAAAAVSGSRGIEFTLQIDHAFVAEVRIAGRPVFITSVRDPEGKVLRP
jgi:serine protease inhibitor